MVQLLRPVIQFKNHMKNWTLLSWSFHMKFMKLAEGSFHKFHIYKMTTHVRSYIWLCFDLILILTDGQYIVSRWFWYKIIFFEHLCNNRNMRRCTFVNVHPTKIQISLRIRAVWSEFSLGEIWVANDAKFPHGYNEYSDQTAGIRRMILSRHWAHIS